MESAHFASAGEFRRWLEANHASASELVLGLRKAAAASPGITYAEALDEALCFGWIDGVRRPYDAQWYLVRFTPRKPRSIWSLVNVRHFERLEKAGTMTHVGRAAYERRDPTRTGVYSFERRPERFPPGHGKRFRAAKKAWSFFCEQPAGYRRVAIHWVTSAKQDQTQARRLDRLIAVSTAGKRFL